MEVSPQRSGGHKGSWWVVLMALCATLTTLAACAGEGSPDKGPRNDNQIEVLNIADAPRAYEQSIRSAFEESYTITYNVEIDYDPTQSGRVKLYKDGTNRQRLDIEKGVEFYEGFSGAVILMFGDRERLVFCLHPSPDRPEGEFGAGEGACFDDADAADAAGTIAYALGIPPEYPDELPQDTFAGLDGVHFTALSSRTIAGRDARCYSVSVPEAEYQGAYISEQCYAETGGLLRSAGPSISADGNIVLSTRRV